MMRLSQLLVFGLALALTLPASADRTDLTGAPPIMDAKPYRTSRHEVSPTFGFGINDAYQRTLSAGLGYRYFVNNWLGVGVDLMGTYLSLDSALTEQIDEKLSAPGQSGRPSTSNISFLATGGVTLVPLYGKMMLFGKLPMSYDVHVLAGAGWVGFSGQGLIDSGGSFAPVVGVGFRAFVSEWISAQVTIRDYMLIDQPLVAEASVKDPPGGFEQNFMVTIGVSFFFPPEFETGL